LKLSVNDKDILDLSKPLNIYNLEDEFDFWNIALNSNKVDKKMIDNIQKIIEIFKSLDTKIKELSNLKLNELSEFVELFFDKLILLQNIEI